MALRRLIHRAINRGFEWAPNDLVYLEHRLKRRGARDHWKTAPYYLIHIPKSGGQSIAEALSLDSPGHVRYRDLPAALTDALRDRPHVAVIRDPLQRLRSIFRYAHMVRQRAGTTKLAAVTRYKSLSAFIRDGLEAQDIHSHYFLRPAVDFLAGAPRAQLHLIPFDRLQEGVDALHQQLRLPPLQLPRKNVTADVIPMDMTVDAAVEAKVRAIYGDDLALYEAIRARPLSLATDVTQ